MKTELKKRARAWYLGFLFFCACEAILNIYYRGKLRELFNSAPDEVVLMNFLI